MQHQARYFTNQATILSLSASFGTGRQSLRALCCGQAIMSSAQKRASQEDGTGSPSDKGEKQPKKTKLGPSDGGDDTAALQRHLDEALDFINSSGLASSTTSNLTCHTWSAQD